MTALSLSLLMWMLDLDGLNSLWFEWWNPHAASHIRQPWHFDGL